MSPITLHPGTPDDDNRDYLPAALKGSDLVVNENGNNSQPYPARLQEVTEAVVDGEPDTWYLYVPDSYRSDRPTPLVISMHGGLMTGWGQAVYTSWTMLAEREGFLVVFPNAHARNCWLIDIPEATEVSYPEGRFSVERPPSAPEDNRDVRLIFTLIERLVDTHNVDRERIYMQGMSMGDAMTDQFARHFGDRLAGAAGSGGPTTPSLLLDERGGVINRAGPVPVWQTRLELDDVPPYYELPVQETVKTHREYWLTVNGSRSTPEISVRGVDNLAFFAGGSAPVVFRDVKNRDHGQTLDDAELVWSYLFSGTRRLPDGRIELSEPRRARRGDTTSIALVNGSPKAWLDQRVVDVGGTPFFWHAVKYHGLQGRTESRGSYLYAPVPFIAQALGALLEQDDGRARLSWADGAILEVARGSIVVLVDGDVTAMPAEAVERDGQLFLPFEWAARDLRGLRTSSSDGVLYATDHHAELSRNMALLITELVGVTPAVGGADMPPSDGTPADRLSARGGPRDGLDADGPVASPDQAAQQPVPSKSPVLESPHE